MHSVYNEVFLLILFTNFSIVYTLCVPRYILPKLLNLVNNKQFSSVRCLIAYLPFTLTLGVIIKYLLTVTLGKQFVLFTLFPRAQSISDN